MNQPVDIVNAVLQTWQPTEDGTYDLREFGPTLMQMFRDEGWHFISDPAVGWEDHEEERELHITVQLDGQAIEIRGSMAIVSFAMGNTDMMAMAQNAMAETILRVIGEQLGLPLLVQENTDVNAV